MILQAYFTGGAVEYRRKETGGTFCVVNPDYNQVWSAEDFRFYKLVSRNTRNGIPYSPSVPSYQGAPATARFVDDTPVKFVRDLQFYVHALCSEKSPRGEAQNKKDFRSMFRDNAFMSNFAGTNTRADYINNNGLPPEIQLQPMACGGTLLKFIGETIVKRTGCYLIEAINPEVEYKKYHPSTHPWLFFRPSISARVWITDGKGGWKEKREWFNEPFDDYGGEAVIPVFGFRADPRSSTGWVNVIEKGRARVVSDTIPNPWILRAGVKANPYAGL